MQCTFGFACLTRTNRLVNKVCAIMFAHVFLHTWVTGVSAAVLLLCWSEPQSRLALLLSCLHPTGLLYKQKVRLPLATPLIVFSVRSPPAGRSHSTDTLKCCQALDCFNLKGWAGKHKEIYPPPPPFFLPPNWSLFPPFNPLLRLFRVDPIQFKPTFKSLNGILSLNNRLWNQVFTLFKQRWAHESVHVCEGPLGLWMQVCWLSLRRKPSLQRHS